MDSLRDNYIGAARDSWDAAFDDDADQDPPPPIENDERRMQVRAYNFWASLLDDRKYPDIESLDIDKLRELGPHGVLLDFSDSRENPAIAFLGDRLAEECGVAGAVGRLVDVPSHSLLSRITDHYVQILANQAPIGFEAEFVNQRGRTILYRGVLLPFSSDDDTIDFIFGAINWKELADAQAADELLLEIEQALDRPEDRHIRRGIDVTMPHWADGPGSPHMQDLAPAGAETPLDREDSAPEQSSPLSGPAKMDLADWLASAREFAQTARTAADRSRQALYDAVSRAYDFSLAAADAPDEFDAMVAQAGLTIQDRAPMTPVVKLVFGADYDKTRLTEYAAVLSHAHRHAIGCGALADYLANAQGGLKGVVQAERDLRRGEEPEPAGQAPVTPRASLARKLRTIAPRSLFDVAPVGEEFALVMIRRTDEGEVVMLGEVGGDRSMIEKAARSLLG